MKFAWLAILIMISVFAWAIWRKKGSFVFATPQGETNNSGGETQSKGSFPIVQGSRGENVKKLQEWLNKEFGFTLLEDGMAGPNTFSAWRTIQPGFTIMVGSGPQKITWGFFQLYVK